MSQHTQWPTDWPFTTLSVGRSSCTILHYGAHIVSCKLAGSQEIFWLSPQSDYTVGRLYGAATLYVGLILVSMKILPIYLNMALLVY